MIQTTLSIKQACAATGLSRTKFYQLLNSGDIKARKIGKRTIILQEDLNEFLNSLETYTPEHKEL